MVSEPYQDDLPSDQELIFELSEHIWEVIQHAPSKRALRRILDELHTGDPDIDRQVREEAQVMYLLALARPYLA